MLNEDGTSRQPQTTNSQTKPFKFGNQKQESTYENNAQVNTSVTSNTTSPQYHQYLGEASGAIPEFPEIVVGHGSSLPEDCTLEDIDTFRSIYREHCEAFLDAVLNFEFGTVESLWREFWRSQDNNNGDECEEEKYLSKYVIIIFFYNFYDFHELFWEFCIFIVFFLFFQNKTLSDVQMRRGTGFY